MNQELANWTTKDCQSIIKPTVGKQWILDGPQQEMPDGSLYFSNEKILQYKLFKYGVST